MKKQVEYIANKGEVTLIANPIYDVVFKYLMEDNAIAKLMVSSIIGEEVVWLDPRPQEYVTETFKVGQTTHKEVMEQMKMEDMYLLYLKDVERKSREEEREIVEKEMESKLAQKDQELEEQRKKNEELAAQVEELKKLMK